MYNFIPDKNTMSSVIKLTSEGKVYEFTLVVDFNEATDEHIKALAFKEFKTRKFQDSTRVNDSDVKNSDKNPDRILNKRAALKAFSEEQEVEGHITVRVADYPISERASRKVMSLDEQIDKASEIQQRRALKKLLIAQFNSGIITQEVLDSQLKVLKLDEIVL